jgi:hypothetical protein
MARVTRASLPPPSPSKENPSHVETVGIPTKKQSLRIKNINEHKWNDGNDSGAEQGPIYDAVADQPNEDVEKEDKFLNTNMVDAAEEDDGKVECVEGAS